MGDLSNLHSGSSGNVDAIHEKNSQGGAVASDWEQVESIRGLNSLITPITIPTDWEEMKTIRVRYSFIVTSMPFDAENFSIGISIPVPPVAFFTSAGIPGHDIGESTYMAGELFLTCKEIMSNVIQIGGPPSDIQSTSSERWQKQSGSVNLDIEWSRKGIFELQG